ADPPCISGDDHSQAIQEVKISNQRRFKLAPELAFAANSKLTYLSGKIHFAKTPLRIFTCPERFELCEESRAHRRHNIAHRRAVPTGDQFPVAGNQIHES